MSCCGGGCFTYFQKKQRDPAPQPIQTPEPSPPSPSIHPPPDPSMPSTHPPVEPSSSKKPFSPTLAEVLKSFEKADVAKADDFIKAIREQLEGATAQKESTSSSNTDKLSNWAYFIQSGATFLKFASDHGEKIHTKGDFFQSGEVTKIVGNMLQQFGQVHWAVAGLSIVGYLVSKCQKVSDNRTGCLDLLKVMIDLASHIKNLNFLTLGKEIKKKLENAFQYIVEGSISCASQLGSGKFFSFLKSSINSDTLSGIRSKIDLIYQDLQLTTGIKALEQQHEISALQQEMATKQQEMLARQPLALPLSQPGYPKNAVGIEEQLGAVNTLLNMKKSKDCTSSAIVIWGVGGIGKTTLAHAVVSTVDRKSYNYARIELDEVSEKNNYKVMQQQILKDAFPSYEGGGKIELRDDADGRDKLTEAFKSETNKPVFVFIDNALHIKDLEKILPEDLRGLPKHSRILITTRILNITDMLEERGLQRNHHQVQTLSPNHAMEILCNDPAIRDRIKDDLEKIVKLCNGIPLVLKMVGAHLCKQKYNVDPRTQILRALQSGGTIQENNLSNRLFDFVYKKLEVSTQEAFLDICCFFDKGFPRRIAEYILGAEEVTSLHEAALITTVMGQSEFFDEVWEEDVEVLSVHDIIRSIGRSLSKSSRIMDLNSWREAEKDEAKLKGIKGVWLQDEDCTLEKRHLNSMEDTLRILFWVGSIDVSATDAVRLPELRCMLITGDMSWVNVEALDKLGVLWCAELPTKRRPLKLPESSRLIIVKKQPAVMRDLLPNSSLEELDLSFSDPRKPSNEERDNIENAFNSFLHGLNKLKTLRVKGCDSLCELPQQVCMLPQLRRLGIQRCSNMERLPQLFGQLKTLTHLDLSECESLKELPDSFGQLETLTYLNLSECESLEELPESFGQLKTLTHLDLFDCESLKELPSTFAELEALQWLNLWYCSSLEKLPRGFEQLRSLQYLNLRCCYKLESDICLMDGNIKIVQKSEHFCTDCQKDKKLKIVYL